MAVSVDIEKKLHGFTLKVKLESDGKVGKQRFPAWSIPANIWFRGNCNID